MGVLVEAIQGELMAVEIWYNNYLLQHLLSDLFCFICWWDIIEFSGYLSVFL